MELTYDPQITSFPTQCVCGLVVELFGIASFVCLVVVVVYFLVESGSLVYGDSQSIPTHSPEHIGNIWGTGDRLN